MSCALVPSRIAAAFIFLLVGSTQASAQTSQRMTLVSRGSEDGYIREAGERSGRGGRVTIEGRKRGARTNAEAQGGGAILAGDDSNNRQLKGLLSFDTSALPDDATILEASLQLTRGKTAGNPAALGALSIDIRSGAFGLSQALEARDFEAASTQERVIDIPLIAGSFSLALPTASFSSLNRLGLTQFRLAFAKATNRDEKNSQAGFYSGEADQNSLRPQLTIVFRSGAPAVPTETPVATPIPPTPSSPQPTPTPIPTASPTPASGGIWKPRPGTSWQWQLTETIDTSLAVSMYDIDLYTTSQAVIDELKRKGRTVICYFSAGSYEDYRPDKAQFPAAVLGQANGWPGEKWLDIRRLDVLGPIMRARLDLAVQKGCDGVEPDNVDGYANSTGFPLSYADQLAFNRFLSSAAHERGLSVGLKNDLDQVKDLVNDFDWALNEQCFQYQECEALLPFVQANKAVFGVEYKGTTATFCPKANAMNFDWLKKSLDLDAAREACR